MVDLKRPDGTVERLPMAAVRGMSDDPDPRLREGRVRRRRWRRGRRSRFRSPRRSTASRAGRTSSTSGAATPDSLAARRCTTTTSTARRSRRCRQACVESFPDFRRYLKAKAKLLGKDAAPVVGPRRHRSAQQDEALGLGRHRELHRRAVRDVLRQARGARRARVPRAVDRRRAARGQARRRLLHGRAPRRVAHPRELHAHVHERRDRRARARPRVPQHQHGRPDAVPAPHADGAGRDGEHVLRDDRVARDVRRRARTTRSSASSTATSSGTT